MFKKGLIRRRRKPRENKGRESILGLEAGRFRKEIEVSSFRSGSCCLSVERVGKHPIAIGSGFSFVLLFLNQNKFWVGFNEVENYK